MSSILHTPFNLGIHPLRNRIVMAPLTRRRATDDHVPTAIMTSYYEQRASAGLIVAEATAISPQALGYMNVPGIYSEEQSAAWSKVTGAVHRKGGTIFLQLWHVGRISHPSVQPGGILPVSASAIGVDDVINTPKGHFKMVTPRALKTKEIPGVIDDYRKAALLAMKSGFDGVEVHAANSYLIDQFLHDSSNKRTDKYGGTVENRSRFMMEVVEAVCNAVGNQNTGIRLSPSNIKNDMNDNDPVGLYEFVIRKLNDFGLAYLHLVEPLLPLENYPLMLREVTPHFRKFWKGPLISCGKYTFEKAVSAIQNNYADLIAFGKPFIANPDLVERFAAGASLNTPDVDTFYYGGEKGYLDYHTL
jgi:N-ethylmaleimide reductase